MNSCHAMDILHEPLIPILRHVLAVAGLPRNGVVLDLASGAGLKLPLLRDACGPHVTLLALDHDYSAMADCAKTDDRRPTTDDRRPQSLHHSLTMAPCHLVTGDVHALPLVDDCIASACCIASWSLFADPVAVLHELRRVIEPGGTMLIVSGTQAWAEVTRWPPALAEQLQSALARAHADGRPGSSTPEAGDEIVNQCTAAGLHTPQVRAFLLDAPDPAQAELVVVPWRALRAGVAPYLDGSTLRAAEKVAATSEIELCTLVLAAQAVV
jgi:SAM-dependent methyltransferase